MRTATVDMMKKVKTILIENEYISAQEISDQCNLSKTSIYRIIRLMRMEGIGVHVTPKGYILSEMAQKRDDTHFLRRLNGRRTSDIITFESSVPHIKKRWRGVEDKKNMGIALKALGTSSMKIVTEGYGAIKALENKHGF